MSEELSVPDVLERAADLLWVRGRARGSGLMADGSMCARGAIAAASGCNPLHVMVGPALPATAALERYLAQHAELLPSGFLELRPDWVGEGCAFPAWIWNDRTADDEVVIDTMRRCAKELRASEVTA